jgi:hypothetical protein
LHILVLLCDKSCRCIETPLLQLTKKLKKARWVLQVSGGVMFSNKLLRVATSSVLALILVLSTMPLSAADFQSPVGNVSVVGNVKVRDVLLHGETTLFSGDRISTGNGKSFAKVVVKGNRYELLNNTDILVSETNTRLNTRLTAGAAGFEASSNPAVITVADYDVLPGAGSRGVVAIVNPEYAGVYVSSGTVTLQQRSNKKSIVISTGTDRLINLKTGQMQATPIAQLASLKPSALPAAAQGPTGGGARGQGPTPGGRTTGTGGGGGLSTGAWVGIIAAIAGGVTILAVTVGGDDDASKSRPR